MSSFPNFRISFYTKLFIWFLIVSILPVLTLGTLTYMISSQVSMKNLEGQAIKTVNQATTNLERKIGEYGSALSFFSSDKEVINIINSDGITEKNRTSIYQKMYIMLAGKSATVCMHLLKADGSFAVSTSDIPRIYNIKDHKDWGIFRKLNKSDSTIYYSNRYISENGKSYCMAIAHSIFKQGKVIGYAIIDVPADVFQTALDGINPNLPIKYTITDDNYYLLYDQLLDVSVNNFMDSNFRSRLTESNKSRKLYLEDPKRFITWKMGSGDYPVFVVGEVPVELVVINSNYITVTTIGVAIGSVLLCIILSPMIIRNLTKQLKLIIDTMRRVQKGETLARVDVKNNDEFGFISIKLNTMLDNLDELYRTNLEKQNRLRLAELKALHSQINPHFLYNTLDSVKWLAKLNGINDIVLIVSQLGRLLKNSIHNQKDRVQISEEMSIIESYLSIQQIRYSNKFKVNIDVKEDIMKCIVPKLVIQPIVENAIIHGIEDKLGNAFLSIRGWQENNIIIFEIKDDGVGISEEKFKEIRFNTIFADSERDSIGLSNVDKRIKLNYGEQYGLAIKSEVNVGTVMRITMPVSYTDD